MAIIRDDLVYWLENQNVLKDYHTGADLTVTGTPDSSVDNVPASFIGNYDLDGSSEYFVGETHATLSAFSYSFWCYADAATDWMVPVNTYNNSDDWGFFAKHYASTGYFQVQLYRGGTSVGDINSISSNTSAAFQNGNLIHVVVTYDGTTQNIYINGSDEKASTLYSASGNLQGNPLYIGARNNGPDRYYNGKVGQTILFNRALTEAEASDLYNAGAGKTYVEYFPMDEDLESYYNLNSDANDSVGSANGTVSGASATTGILGGGYTFNGTSDYISGIGGTTSTKTVGFWFHTADTSSIPFSLSDGSTTNTFYAIISSTDVYLGLRTDSTGRYSGTGSASGKNDDKWHSVVYTYDGSKYYVYVDGVLNYSETTSYWLDDFTSAVTEGHLGVYSRGTKSDYLAGEMDEVFTSTRHFSAGDAARWHNYGLARTYEQLSNENPLHEGLADYLNYNSDATWTREYFQTEGTVSGATNTTGKIDNAYSFDGVDDEIDFGSLQTRMNDFWSGGASISFWINIASGTNNGFFMDKKNTSNGWYLWWNSGTGKLTLHQDFTVDGKWSTTDISTGSWEYVTITYDSDSNANNPLFYVNGASVTVNEDSTPTSTALYTNTIKFVVGDRDNSDLPWEGLLDETVFYKRELVLADTNALYNGDDGFAYPFAAAAPVVVLTDGEIAMNGSVL